VILAQINITFENREKRMKKLYVLFMLIFCLTLIACSKKEPSIAADAPQSNENIVDAERLGTTWGDEIQSQVRSVSAKRIGSEPIVEVQLRYAAKDFTGKLVNSMSLAAGKISFSVIDDQHKILPLFRENKKYFLSAKDGQTYQLKYDNHTDQAYEVIVSVDGLDVLDGSAASKYNVGYLLYPHSSLIIDGFRKSDSAVASFTFGKPQDSYAANTSQGSEDNTGIIGVSVFEVSLPVEEIKKIAVEKEKYAPSPQAFPADNKN
jgi:hypothetical protein